MLNEEQARQLLQAVMARIDKEFPANNGAERAAKQFAAISARIAVITLSEYEKLSR